jgi:hypothetical protein
MSQSIINSNVMVIKLLLVVSYDSGYLYRWSFEGLGSHRVVKGEKKGKSSRSEVQAQIGNEQLPVAGGWALCHVCSWKQTFGSTVCPYEWCPSCLDLTQ